MKYPSALLVLLGVITLAGSGCSGDVESDQSTAENEVNNCNIKDLHGTWKIYKSLNKHVMKGNQVRIQYSPATSQPPRPEGVRISGNLQADSWDSASCNGAVAVVTGQVEVAGCEHDIIVYQDNSHRDNWPDDCSGLGTDRQECLDEAFTRHLVIDFIQSDATPDECALHNAGNHLTPGVTHGTTAHGGD